MDNFSVLIKIKNMFSSTKIQIDSKVQKMWINYKEVNTNLDKFLSRLFAITASWEGEYYKDVLDAEEFLLCISDGQKTQKCHFKGEYPINYGDIKKLISEVQNG